MQIITYVLEGAIAHEDSLGNKGRTVAGDVQVMSAGTGILHSEFNEEGSLTRLFQIWLDPRSTGSSPQWANRAFLSNNRPGTLATLASGNPRDGALYIDADAAVLGAAMKAGETIVHDLGQDGRGYLGPTAGRIVLNGYELGPWDGAALDRKINITITAIDDTNFVLVLLVTEQVPS